MELRSYHDEDIAYQQRSTSSHWTNTSKEVSTCAWQADLETVLQLSEEAEKELSYLTDCGSELARKQTGSYYTPTDVSAFFWNEFFSLGEISTPREAASFVNKHAFVEPSVGAGAIVFSLFLKLANLGVDKSTIASIDLTLIDINKQALSFVEGQFDSLSKQWGIDFPNIKLVCSDFQKVHLKQRKRPYFFFGNPPFVTNRRNESKWNNSFADFVETSLERIGKIGSLQFILPLSVAFSRDYSNLRKYILEHDRCISLSHFDNIPDTLFKSGKPEHTNSNKANSQRCSILTVRPASKLRIRSTSLIRWSKYDRKEVLSKSPQYHEISSYRFNDQFPRPKSYLILEYIDRSLDQGQFCDLLFEGGKHKLYVNAVARNYIGFREGPASSTHQLRFENKQDFYRALLILGSDLFFDYWKTIGDGFHVTKGNILSFPLHDQLDEIVNSKLTTTQRVWAAREKHKKTKLNSGKMTFSYDFSKRMPALLHETKFLEKESQN
jgi:hypothetical protein